MLDAMLQAAGQRVQRFISPHLVRFNERILLDGDPIPELELIEVLDACEQANDGAPITFEITTAAATWRSPGTLRTPCCWRPGSAAGSTPPTSSSGPASPRSRPSPSITRRSSANAWSRSLREGRHPEAGRALHRRPAAAGGACGDRGAGPGARRAAPCARPGMARAARAIGCWWPSAMPSGIAVAGARGPSPDRQCRPGGRLRAGAEDLAPDAQALAQGLRAAKWPGRSA